MNIFFTLLSIKIKVIASGCGAGSLKLSRVYSATATLSFGSACSGPAEAIPAWSWEFRGPTMGSAKPVWLSHIWTHAANHAWHSAAPCQVSLLFCILASLSCLSAWMCLSVCVTEQDHPNIACLLVVENCSAFWRTLPHLRSQNAVSCNELSQTWSATAQAKGKWFVLLHKLCKNKMMC